MEPDKKDGMLAKDTLEEDVVINTQKLEANDNDDFKGYTHYEKYKLFVLFFFMGIINHLGTILVMTGGRNLAFELGMENYLTIYTSMSIIFALITRILNSKLFIKETYMKRILIVCCCNIIGYFMMFIVLLLHDTALSNYNEVCFVFSFIPCFFLGSSYALGESAMIAYLRYFPKTLISGWSSGTGISGLLGGTLNLVSQLSSFSLKYIYLVLIILGPLYLFLFRLSFHMLARFEITEKKKEQNNTKELKPMTSETEDIKENNEQTNSTFKQEEQNVMEEMNKTNKGLSFDNLKRVMNNCGRVIINLGCIYFLQFFCNNTLIVRCCGKIDMSFLPCNDNKTIRKGKFEFINLFYQVGMLVSKTFIKLVRKIKKIQVYTIAICTINMIYILEYSTGFLGWGNFIWLGLVLGFFGGGTYAGGFYTILNSDAVPENMKELTVNVATLFNDAGTFLSGIIGFLALNYWFNNDKPFEGHELTSDKCP